jgi:rhamnosyltransferase
LAVSTLREARIIVPVRNGGARWHEAAAALAQSVPDPTMVVVIDSSSDDGSDVVACRHGFQLQRIDARDFNHGRTRQEAVERFCSHRSIVIFLTQDAVIESPQTLPTLLGALSEPRIGAAYGRQLPHHGAGRFGAHAALFNYQAISETRWLGDVPRSGIKTAFLSNSFAAYRVDALRACGGFPSHLILSEDHYVAMKMLLSGWGIRYCADASVRHSHDYSIAQEMRRYFDFGVVYAQSPELLRAFGQLEGEGARFVTSEIAHIWRTAPWLLPELAVRTVAKYLGYRLGRCFQRLPRRWCRVLSMTKGYWEAPPLAGPLVLPSPTEAAASEDGTGNQSEAQQRP